VTPLAVWTPQTTTTILARAVAERPDAEALVCGKRTLRYGEYGHAVAAFAAELAGAGTVVILLRNGIEICVAIQAAQAAGAAAAALNPDYSARELAPMLGDADPGVIVTHADLIDKLAGQTARIVVADDLLDRLLDAPPCALPQPEPDSVAVVQFTGGTTGRPKGAMLTHRAVAANVAQRECALPTDFGDERVLCMMPLFHSFAAAMCLNLAAYAAGTLVILPRYRPDWVIEAVREHRITRLPAGPTVFNSLLAYDGFDAAAFASLRCAYSGSAPLPQETLARWEAATGVPVYEGFGQSEAGPVLTYHGPGMALKQGSVGPALPGTELRIGTNGEILARGPQIMTGYLKQPGATAAALADGWLHTGDVGRIDVDGYVFIEDRLKDMAIVGGYNVYPREIDEVLMGCAGVVEAGAVGVPDAYRGEIVWAFFAGAAAAETVAAHCAANLVKYKRPATIRRLDHLPKTGVGKIDKVALRELARRERMADVA
jgi:long-chain acyl-CoA synthetase